MYDYLSYLYRMTAEQESVVRQLFYDSRKGGDYEKNEENDGCGGCDAAAATVAGLYGHHAAHHDGGSCAGKNH